MVSVLCVFCDCMCFAIVDNPSCSLTSLLEQTERTLKGSRKGMVRNECSSLVSLTGRPMLEWSVIIVIVFVPVYVVVMRLHQ